VLHVLDTDTISALQRGNGSIVARRRALPTADVAVTVIYYQEQVAGWLTAVNRHGDGPQLVRVFANLQATIAFYSALRVLPYDAGSSPKASV